MCGGSSGGKLLIGGRGREGGREGGRERGEERMTRLKLPTPKRGSVGIVDVSYGRKCGTVDVAMSCARGM